MANLVYGNRCFECGRAIFSNIASKIQHRSNGKHRLVRPWCSAREMDVLLKIDVLREMNSLQEADVFQEKRLYTSVRDHVMWQTSACALVSTAHWW